MNEPNTKVEAGSDESEAANAKLVSALYIDGAPVRISSSGADQWNNCKRAWYSRYVLGERDGASEASMMGTYVHSALEAFYNGKVRDVKALKENVSGTWGEFKREYTNEFHDGNPLSPEAELTLKLAVWQALEGISYLENPSEVNVVESEMAIDTTFRGLPLRGYIDRVDRLKDGTVAIVDFKTGKTPKKSAYFSGKLRQLFLYAMCLRDMDYDPSVGKLYYTTSRTIIQARTDDKAINKVKTYLNNTVDEIYAAAESGDFPPSTSPLCGWCPLSANGKCEEGKRMVLTLGRIGKLRFDAPSFQALRAQEFSEQPPTPDQSGYNLYHDEEEYR